ncbi:MAG: hypothetical protein ACREF4_17050 [Gammaproteobacteria bacterium]
MMLLARRYAPHLVVLCALALLAVIANSWLRLHREDCADPERFFGSQEEPSARESRLRKGFHALEVRQGRVALDGGLWSLGSTMIRSTQPRTVYYRPEGMVVPGVRAVRRGMEWLDDPSGERLPIHRAWYREDPASGTALVVAYLLVYQGRPVEDPVLAQLRAAPREVFIGAAPMTLLLVSGVVLQQDLPGAEAQARDWLRESWQAYRYACEL